MLIMLFRKLENRFAAQLTLFRFCVEKVEEMMDTSDDKLKNMPLRSALVQGGKDLQTLFGKRSHQLKASSTLLPIPCA